MTINWSLFCGKFSLVILLLVFTFQEVLRFYLSLSEGFLNSTRRVETWNLKSLSYDVRIIEERFFMVEIYSAWNCFICLQSSHMMKNLEIILRNYPILVNILKTHKKFNEKICVKKFLIEMRRSNGSKERGALNYSERLHILEWWWQGVETLSKILN